jgi:dihydroflavonol-4-reductase
MLMEGAMPAAPKIHFGLFDVRDVADLHLRAMTRAAAKGERFIAVAGNANAINRLGWTPPERRDHRGEPTVC